jgi:hypothetical protein
MGEPGGFGERALKRTARPRPPRDPFQPQILFHCDAFGPRAGRFRGSSQLVHRLRRERGASSPKRPKERRFFGPRRLREPLVERRQRKALGER